ncbi:hypothetical protein LCGC14_0946020 [marine sediment metagenome]|uniref:Rubredoxin-like domain-containing protein n=1 Tax=marine sediment metagenome TaxID=412755 RepID=A0A0F9R272_9ZZZZ
MIQFKCKICELVFWCAVILGHKPICPGCGQEAKGVS